ncbi:putative mitochondrial protein [Vitis vinifera]|uniref:Putative mitochondrial protein n=1 Tax=Vitis vinifera TaxID=29760 RepID=A0A438C0R8_VITVI|nr:putative mitochondrial protein [Vitis vinifera]
MVLELTSMANSLTPTSSFSSQFVPISFNHSISIKLDQNNFLIWCQQVEATIKGYKLSKFINGIDTVPPKFLSSTYETSGKINQDFSDWEQQDQLLVSWLLSSMSKGLLTRMVGCVTSFQIWEKLEVFFAAQTRTKIDQFKMQLKSSQKDHIDAIFEGLPSEHDTLITVVTTRTNSYTVDEIEYVLLAQERCIEKATKALDSNLSANLATQSQNNKDKKMSNNSFENGFSTFDQGNFRGLNNFPSRGGSSSRGFNTFRGSSRRGRGGFNGGQNYWNFNKPQCQLCGHVGHLVQQCYYRFDPSFQVPFSFQNGFYSAQDSSQMTTMVATTPEFAYDSSWYLDFGATNHITPDIHNLMNKTEFAGQDKIMMGNGTDQASKEILMAGRVKNGLYLFDDFTLLPSAKPLLVPSSTTSYLWHHRLGHPSLKIDQIQEDLAYVPMQPYKNTHSMITRSKVENFKPKVLATTCEPTCVKEALHVHHWKQAMTDELMALLKNNTWSLVPLPLGRTPIGCKWVFKVKENPDGSIQKYKARLVAKGLHQVAGFDFIETFSPVVKLATIRVMLTIALSRGLGEVNYLLGIEVNHTSEGIHLSQGKYITDLLCKAKMQGANPISTPMTTRQKLLGYGSELVQDVKLYKSIVGAFNM